jgi:hypothetical protein
MTLNAFLVDGCPLMVAHYEQPDCGTNHHVGPVIRDIDVVTGIEDQICGECGKLIGRVAVTAQDARNSRQYCFTGVREDAQSRMDV